jgi:antitoxin component YwqK of YwqJK toxin-antitoxin module|tara:strand:- start:2393 stop:3187 length:795 start_codon:yes stop_codon:yes gene_type:complete
VSLTYAQNSNFTKGIVVFHDADTIKLYEAKKAELLVTAVEWGDELFMRDSDNELSPYVLKNGLEDGLYKCYYEYNFKNLAFQGVIKNGKIHGLTRYFTKSGKIKSEVEYFEGLRHGVNKSYLYANKHNKRVFVSYWDTDTLVRVDFAKCQNKLPIFRFEYGDEVYMVKKRKKWRLKNGLSNGIYIGYNDSTYTTEMLKSTSINGSLNYLEIINNEEGQIFSEYLNGRLFGFVFEKWSDKKEGANFVNLFLYDNGVQIQVLQLQW